MNGRWLYMYGEAALGATREIEPGFAPAGGHG